MMKFLFSFFFVLLSTTGVSNFIGFWFVGLSLVLMMVLFSLTNMVSFGMNFFSTPMMMDSVSYGLVFLSFWVTLLMYFSSYGVLKSSNFPLVFSFLMMVLMLVLLITFSVNNYLLFYFFFEISLVPTLLIITGWGYQPERLQAGIYFLFYTLSLSLPLLLCIIKMGVSMNSYFIFNPSLILNSGSFIEILFFLVLSGAFLVKLPMFFVHLWLPKAHVEAPVAGSMILAGVLLKLGGYGLFRVLSLCPVGVMKFGGYLVGLSIMGMLFVGLICCRLNDFKALVAYSSVAHMALVISGVMSYYLWGYNGSLMMMISHGLSSSGLFCIVNMYYERLGSRSFYINSGLITVFPIFTLMIFFLAAANISAPPTINLISEIFLMASIMSYSYLMMIIFPLGSFLGAVFTLFMFSYSQHGKLYFLNYSFVGVNFREVHTLVVHIIPVNFLILNSDFFLVLF